jgi:putative hemolysin
MHTLPTLEISAPRAAPEPSFHVQWADAPAQIAEAQRLRYRVFAGELGAQLPLAPNAPPAHDIDSFDAFCDHLLVRAHSPEGKVIATCRVLTPAGACRAGGLYTDGEFDLDTLRDLLPLTIEMGRVCIEPAWRNGLVVMAMWRAVGERMAACNLVTMIGCSSVSLSDGGALAGRLWRHLEATHLVPSARRVRPRAAFAVSTGDANEQAPAIPTLMKGYLRCGGRVLGPPAIDRAFNTVDFPMIMQLTDLPVRYTRRIFATAA